MITNKEYNQAINDYSRNLYRYLYKCLKDDQVCLDIIQDCFLKLWQHREKIDPAKIRSWLFTCAHNAMMDLFKYRKRYSNLHELDDTNADRCHAGSFEAKDLLDKALEELPEVQKSVILLRDLEGYSYKEIGEIIDLTDAQVKVYLFRARQSLMQILEKLSITR